MGHQSIRSDKARFMVLQTLKKSEANIYAWAVRRTQAPKPPTTSTHPRSPQPSKTRNALTPKPLKPFTLHPTPLKPTTDPTLPHPNRRERGMGCTSSAEIAAEIDRIPLPRKALRGGIQKSIYNNRLVNFYNTFPQKWLQERGNGSKNEDEIPPRRAFCGPVKVPLSPPSL